MIKECSQKKFESPSNLIEFKSDEESSLLGFLSSDQILTLKSFQNPKIEFQIGNVTKFTFLNSNNSKYILCFTETEENENLKIFEFSNSSFVELKISEIQFPSGKIIEKEIFSKNCLLSSIKSGGDEFSIYNSTLHFIYIFKISKNQKGINIENILNFHTFSRVFSMLMTGNLILLGSTSSVHIYNWKLLLKKKLNDINLKEGRCVYLPKKTDKELIIGLNIY
jgi:hypothetical protein